jgi:hypothetical protein
VEDVQTCVAERRRLAGRPGGVPPPRIALSVCRN